MDKISINGGKTGSVTPSTALLNQKLGTSPAPRMLTPSEIELLGQSKREIAARRATRARLGAVHPLHLRVDVDEHETARLFPAARACAYPRGNAGLSTELAFMRFEPMIVPKRSLSGDSTERMDTRVLLGPARALPAVSSPAAAVSSHSVPPSTGRS